MDWLFKNTPREAFGAETLALHDQFVSELYKAKLLGPKSKRDKAPPPESLADAINRHYSIFVENCIPSPKPDQSDSSGVNTFKTYLTMALACSADECGDGIIRQFLAKTGHLGESRSWIWSGGLHLAASMIDVKPEFLGLLVPRLAKMSYTTITERFQQVYISSILNGMESLKLPVHENDLEATGFSFQHLALCRGGYLELPPQSRASVLQVAIQNLKRVKGFDSHKLNEHSANLRDLMKLLVFNAGFMLMLRKTPMATIENSLRPVFDNLMTPYGLAVDDLEFLWRRAQLCLYSPFQEYYTQLKTEAGELFGGDQARAKTLFHKIGVHVDQMDPTIVLKKGLGILYDPKNLATSNHLMPGWSTPIDAFAQGLTDHSKPAVAMLRMLGFEHKSPGLEAISSARLNTHQLLAVLITQDGYDSWLEELLSHSPRSLPASFAIELALPLLSMDRFSTQAQQNLVMLYAEFMFKSFFKVKSPFNDRRLEEVVDKFRANTDSFRQSIPGFSITMIRGMKDAQVLSDQIMRHLEFTGSELSAADVGSSGLNIDDLLAKDLGL
ncbi:hypothetical protein [Pseudomonas amygdali]|uniref:Uncharacterized protein n=2 Tax=Pseudomonas amygdali pv. lachrymans TaxID=53707 RepID=A0ABR5KR59_PSEAV|nr:hypothetical protein [Pseudomonas amygdali]AXH59889.1 hypothetical protein PLA107_032200 [Pseudomonas amygdali pv. lachrymans str. M301315]KPC17301.1 Uncharacterized protein AC499_0503 [Pseudomonas amygdali pv. lachrymans]RMT05686.1 hypothetical protein ALP54_06406 [Pseudomonas amygdali pv. lachrymans]